MRHTKPEDIKINTVLQVFKPNVAQDKTHTHIRSNFFVSTAKYLKHNVSSSSI